MVVVCVVSPPGFIFAHDYRKKWSQYKLLAAFSVESNFFGGLLQHLQGDLDISRCLLITWTFYNTTASNAKGASMYERERGREKRGRSRGRQRCLAWQQEKKNIHVANLVCEMLSSVCSCCWMCDCVCHVDVMLNLDTHCRIFHNMHLFEDAHGGREVRDKPSREAKQMYKQFLKFVKLLKTFQSSIAVLCRGFLFLLKSLLALLWLLFCYFQLFVHIRTL